MDKKLLSEIIGGKGTFSEPFVVRNNLVSNLDRIPEGGYDYELPRIKGARELLNQTEMSDEHRARFSHRIDTKELRCRAQRPRYLLSRASEIARHGNNKRADSFRSAAKVAYADFKTFAEEHPAVVAEHMASKFLSKIFNAIQELE